MADPKAAKAYLRQMAHAKDLLQDLLRERDELREIAGDISSPGLGDRVQTSQGHEAAFVRKLDRVFAIEERIESEIAKISEMTIDVNRRIEALPNYDERRVIRCRYLDALTWDEVAYKMNISLRTAHRLHAAALQHLEIPVDNPPPMIQ